MKDELSEMAQVEVYMLGSQKSVKNYNGKARPITNGGDKESTRSHTNLAFKSAGALDQSNARRRSVLGEIQNLPSNARPKEHSNVSTAMQDRPSAMQDLLHSDARPTQQCKTNGYTWNTLTWLCQGVAQGGK